MPDSQSSEPGFHPALLPFRRLGIFVLSIDAPVGCINEYLAIGSGGNVSDLVVVIRHIQVDVNEWIPCSNCSE